jgi:glucose/arabinose dehydrogenase
VSYDANVLRRAGESSFCAVINSWLRGFVVDSFRLLRVFVVNPRWRRVMVVCSCLCVFVVACNKDDPEPAPSEDAQVSPGDRLGWTQPAPDAADIASVQFALYIDGTRTTLTGAACVQTASAFECSAVLPSMPAGRHTLQLAAFVSEGNTVAESSRSASLRVSVAARAAAVISTASIPVVTVDEAKLHLTFVADGVMLPSDLAFAPDGRIFVAERGGTVRVIRNGVTADEPALDLSSEISLPAGGLLAIALDPRFDESGLMYALYAAAAPREGQEFMLARFRSVDGGVFGERVILLDRTPASAASASGALRFGADGKLYLALDSSADSWAAGSFASYNGKVLRLNADATTPEDTPEQSPIFSFDHPQPLAMDWQPSSGQLWVIDRVGLDAGRLSAVAADAKQRHAAFRTSYALPPGTGASSATFYRGALMPMFRGNLFVAAETGGELMRLRFDPNSTTRIVSVERLLKDQIGGLRVVSEGNDGALYIATTNALYRLAP